MKILITGGAGWIGGITASLFREAGHEVVIFDNLSTGFKHNAKSSRLIQGDLRDKEALNTLFQDPFDVVVHFAAKLDVGESMRDPALYFENNVVGSINLIDATVSHGVNKVIFSSSATVYGEPDTIPIPESAPLRPINPYGHSKLIIEHVLKSYEQSHNLEWLALRYFNPIGAHDGIHQNPRVSNIVPAALNAIAANKPMKLFGDTYDTPDGTCIRDYVDVVDIARAHVLAATKTHLRQAINLGSGQGYSVKDILKAVSSAAGKEVPFEIGPRREGDAAAVIASNDRARELLGWATTPNLEKMVRSAVDAIDS